MANQKQLDILRQGVIKWNIWRGQNQGTHINLSRANLSRANLSEADLRFATLSKANLSEAILSRANLSRADLSEADLRFATLSKADLSEANLSRAILSRADLSRADLSRANLSGANLSGAYLSRANLNGADLSEANLSEAIFIRTDLSEAILIRTDLSEANVGWTIFASLDLRPVKGLEAIHHHGPSEISTSTLTHSQGDIPEIFLRGAGLDDTFIDYVHSLTRKPIEYYTCFISYSSKDKDFAKRLYADLQNHNIRCWFAPEDMKIGDKIRARIDESIRLYDKLLLILSEHAIASNWVEYEVEAALAKERREQRTVLFPVRLDMTVMESTTAWAAHVQNTRHIGNFERWKDHDSYKETFERLLRDLKADAVRDTH